MSQAAVCLVMSSHSDYINVRGYRRTESEPAAASNKTLGDIRSKFEKSDSFVAPEFGLAFGAKKSQSLSEEVTAVTAVSPKPFHKLHGQPNGLISCKTIEEQQITVDANCNKRVADKVKRPTGFGKMEPRNKASITNTKLIGNNCYPSKQITPDKENTLIALHNAGIVSLNKLNQSAPTSPSVVLPNWGKIGFNRVKSSDCDSMTSRSANSQLSSPTGAVPDYIYTSKIDSKLLAAKSFWNKKSQEIDPSSITAVELGTDFSPRNQQKTGNGSKQIEEKPSIPLTAKNLKAVDKNDNHLDVSSASRYLRLASVNSEDTKSIKSSHSLSKSPSQSSVSSSLDGMEQEYLNVVTKVPRRTNSKPPQNIVARRTQLFEKAAESIGASPEEAEAYRRMKELGTAFKPKDETDTPSTSRSSSAQDLYTQLNKKERSDRPRPVSTVITGLKPQKPEEPDSRIGGNLLAKNDKLTDKPVEMFKNTTYESATNSVPGKMNAKPQNQHNSSSSAIGKSSSSFPVPAQASQKPKPYDKGQAMFNSIMAARAREEVDSVPNDKPELPAKPSKDNTTPPLPPPKPPRTFQHTRAATDANEYVEDPLFDPAEIPRQDGDGQEEEKDDSTPCNVSSASATDNQVPDNRVYTSTTPAEPRPYTSLTMNDGSGGDDSLYGSENAYDTLGKCSAASSYDHYDTISQSELDSDVSRPPTLPRRPSNLRHSRPLSTAFGALDIKNQVFHSQLQKALTTQQPIKETSPTSPSPTKIKVPFKLKYLLPKTKRKTDEMRKAASVSCLTADSLYDTVQILPPGTTLSDEQLDQSGPFVAMDEAGYAVPEINKAGKKTIDSKSGSDSQLSKADKNLEKIRVKLNHAFSALKKPPVAAAHSSDGEDEERPPDPEVMEERLKHCTTVKANATYASAEQIKGFMTRVYAQLYDYAVIVGLRKNPDTNIYEPYVKFKFPPQVNVEQTTVPQFCFPDSHIWHKTTDYKSEAFSFVLTDVTGNRQYGYCRRVLPPDLNNLPRTPEVICVVSPLNATKFYSELLDEVEKRRLQSSIHAEEFLQAIYGRPMPSPGHSVTIRAMDLEMYEALVNVYEEPESLVFTRSPDAQREGICYECLINMLSVSQIVKIFASMLLERKIIFIAEKLSTLSSCVHAFVSLLYPFSWQHTFIPLLPPNLIDVVCAPTPFIVGILSSNFSLLNSLGDEMEEVLIVDLDNHKFIQRAGDEKTILPKKLHRALVSALDMAKSESQGLRNLMVSEGFLRFFLETTGNFNEFMIHVPGEGRQFQKEEFVTHASTIPSISSFLLWFTETQMFEVYTTERENDRNVISGTFEERAYEFKSENHDGFHIDNRRFKKFKLFGKKGKR